MAPSWARRPQLTLSLPLPPTKTLGFLLTMFSPVSLNLCPCHPWGNYKPPLSPARFLTQEPVGLFALVSCQVFIMTTWTDDPDSGSSGYLCLAKSGWKSGLPCLSFSLILSQKMNKAPLFLSYHSSSFLITHHIPKQPHVSTHILKPAI